MNILVKGMNWIGDAVMSTPFFSSLRLGFPDDKITVLSRPAAAEILKNNPDIDDLIIIDEKINKFKTIRLLRQRHFDQGILLPRSLSSALLLSAGGVRNLAGYNTQGRGLLLKTKIAYTDVIKARHQIYLHLNIAEQLGCPQPQKPALKLFSDKVSDEKISSLLKPNQRYLLILPATAGGSFKQWKVEYFAEVANYFIKKKDFHIIISGAPNEAETGEKLIARINTTDKVLNLIGRNPLPELIALIKKVDFVLGNDSGPLHIAAALNTPSAAIFTSTNPALYGPLSANTLLIAPEIECAPCSQKKGVQQTFICHETVTPGQVIAKVESHFTFLRSSE